MTIREKVKDIIKRINGEVPTSTLKKRGMKVGNNFNRQQGCFIDPSHCFLISIGDNQVEHCLRGMLVGSVAGVYDRSVGHLGGVTGRAFEIVAHDDEINVVAHHLDRVLESLTLR